MKKTEAFYDLPMTGKKKQEAKLITSYNNDDDTKNNKDFP